MSPRPTRRPFPVLPVAIGAIAVVAAIGIAIAASGGEEDPSSPADVAAFGPVVVEGTPLPELGDGPDPAVGQPAPTAEGLDPDDEPVTLGRPGQPTLVAFLAHWCPHCQAELPRLVSLMEAGDLEGVRMVAVLTGTDANAPNYPPVAWLEREGWSGEVLLDDDQGSAATAYGRSGYPFIVALDADGTVVDRRSGERTREEVLAMAAAAQG